MEAYQRIEKEWADYHDVDPACMVVCNSGTAALHLALEAMQLPQGSEVLVPDFTMIACARAVTMAGFKPVFIDCGADLLMDPHSVEQACRRPRGNVRAIMPVHIYGRCCDMETIGGLAYRHKLRVIEDAAECPLPMGPLADARTWSFYLNKIVCGEEGGAVAFRYKSHAETARQLRSHGFTAEHNFTHIPRGHNYRLANALALAVLSSLSTVEASVSQRRAAERAYDALCPPAWRMPRREAPWVYDMRVQGLTEEQGDTVIGELNEQGIAARHAFKPMSTQEEYRNVMVPVGEGAYRAAREVLYLPLAEVTQGMVDVAMKLLTDRLKALV